MFELIRFHNSPTFEYNQSLINLDTSIKPQKSLWLSDENQTDDCWSSWCKNEEYENDPDWIPPHKFKFFIDESKILHVDNEEKIFRICLDYSRKSEIERAYTKQYRFIDRIRWHKLAEKYSGILISPWRKIYNRVKHPMFMYVWDCSSAAIWNEDAIIKIERAG